MIEQQNCPSCDTPMQLAVYGLPDSALAADQSVKLMGCLVDEGQPEWFCPTCETYF